MTLLVTGLVLFFVAHSLAVVAPTWRERTIERFGRPAWVTLYSLASILTLWMIVRGYSAARLSPIVWYVPAPWMYSLARLLMVAVFPLLLASVLPGTISRVTRHPALVAIKIWAVAHLLANGMAADVLLFGGFLAWAVIDRISLKRRAARTVRSRPERRINDSIAVVVGFALYAVFAGYLHVRLFGVSPFAF